MRDPIYKPKGAAGEYGELALNIYQGCPHGCTYCYVPGVLRRARESFHSNAALRPGIIEATEKQLAKGDIKGQTIFLCFTCDPYPVGWDSTATREIIKLIKGSGNHVKILTKGYVEAQRDFDLLGENDQFGVTITGGEKEEPGSARETTRELNLIYAHERGIKTWVSCEPVLDVYLVLNSIRRLDSVVDHWAIGKLNHRPSSIDWADFGRRAEELCQALGRSYTIKDDLRKAMAIKAR